MELLHISSDCTNTTVCWDGMSNPISELLYMCVLLVNRDITKLVLRKSPQRDDMSTAQGAGWGRTEEQGVGGAKRRSPWTSTLLRSVKKLWSQWWRSCPAVSCPRCHSFNSSNLEVATLSFANACWLFACGLLPYGNIHSVSMQT